MDNTKISFGFSKLVKKANIILPVAEEEKEKKIELIDCLENQSIKIKNAIPKVKKLLIIPLKDNKKDLADRIREYRAKKSEKKENDAQEDTRPDSELTLDELAAKQLVQDAKELLNNGLSATTKVSIVKLNNNVPSFEGESESTLEDYESVPIQDFGLAMLRGMGWKDGMGIGKNASKSASEIPNVPEVRPKGLGLGAERIIQQKIAKEKRTDKGGKEMVLVKGGFAKIIAGVHRGCYCKVQGFDGKAGRVVVQITPKNVIANINEILVIPVSEKEFATGSRILNTTKYDEYMTKKESNESSSQIQSNSRNMIDTELSREEVKLKSRIKKEKFRNSSSESDIKSCIKREHKSKKKSKKRRSRSRSRDRKEKSKNHNKHHKRKYSPDSDCEKNDRLSSRNRRMNKYK